MNTIDKFKEIKRKNNLETTLDQLSENGNVSM